MHEPTALFDVLSTIEATASAALVVVVLSFTLSKTVRGRQQAVLVISL